jgi:hypothetical protein
MQSTVDRPRSAGGSLLTAHFLELQIVFSFGGLNKVNNDTKEGPP